ncbi:MAG TPA: hypothetical protein VMU47_07145 [Caldimonas sp.]|nr:hypothetical protein [Caldimonas sp.]
MTDDVTPPGRAPADEARDAHLRAALRHAPDADARPPDAVSARILAVARASSTRADVSRDSARRRQGRLASMLAGLWISAARPSMAGAFATVVVATLVGVLWWERPIDVAMVRPAPVEPSAPPAATTAPPATLSKPTLTSPSALPKPASPSPAEQATPLARVAPPAARAPDAFPAPAGRRQAPRSSVDAPSRSVEPAPEHASPPVDDAAAADQRTDVRGDRSAPTAAAAHERSEAEPVPKALRKSETQGFVRRERDANLAAAPAAEPRDQLSAAAPQAPAAAGLAGLRARVQSAPEQWTWTRDGIDDRHPGAALTTWLAEAEQAARANASATNAAGKDAATPAGSEAARLEIQLFEAGRRRAIVRVTAAGIDLVDETGRMQRIRLDPSTSAALAASAPR